MNNNNLVQNFKSNKIHIKKIQNPNGEATRKPGLGHRTPPSSAKKCALGDNFVAPDGGWGWMVAVASGVSILVTYPVLQQFGILFRTKFSQIGISSSELTTIINFQQAAAMCSGLINAPLFRRFSHRQVALLGNFFVFSGLFIAAFANSFFAYFISISLLYGTGRGIMFSTMTVAVNTYFKTKRQEATAYQYAVAGIGPMVLPYIVTFFVSYYGVAGAVLLLSGLSLHNLPCSAIYQPVKWHVKKVLATIPLQDLEKNEEHSDLEQTNIFETCELEINKEVYNSNGSKVSETKFLSEEQEPLNNTHNTPDVTTGKKLSVFGKIVATFDLDLLKDFGYVNIVLGLTLMNIIHMNFHYLTPFILSEFGLGSSEIAAAMTVEAVCGFVMKFLLVVIVVKLKCDSKTWLLIGCLAMALGRLMLALGRNNHIMVLACFSWIGICSAILLVFWVLVLPNYVPLNKLPAAIGLQRLIMGICNLIIGPFIGLINGPLFRRFSHSQAAVIGNFFVFFGLLSAAFSNSYICYLISISLLYGIGRGIMFTTTTVAVNTYFKKKRQEASAYQYAVAGIGPMILPYVVTFLVSYYGVAGAVLLLSGFSLHNLACAAIFQPVELHVKKTPANIPLNNLKEKDENLNSTELNDFETNNHSTVHQQSTNDSGKPNKINSLPEGQVLLNKPERSPDSMAEKKSTILEKIVATFDLDLLKDFGYVNIILGLTLMNIIHMNFHYLTPFILNEFGLGSSEIAAAMTVEAVCGFVMKFLLVLILAKMKCDCKIWLLISSMAMALGRLLLVFNRNRTVMLVCFGWIGINWAMMIVFWILVLPSYVPLNKLPAAIGLHRLIMGLFNLITAPLIGLIRDATNFTCVIHIMNAVIVFVTISWLIEDLCRKRRQTRKQNKQMCD